MFLSYICHVSTWCRSIIRDPLTQSCAAGSVQRAPSRALSWAWWEEAGRGGNGEGVERVRGWGGVRRGEGEEGLLAAGGGWEGACSSANIWGLDKCFKAKISCLIRRLALVCKRREKRRKNIYESKGNNGNINKQEALLVKREDMRGQTKRTFAIHYW